MNERRQYVRARDVAELFGMDVRTIRRRIADGTLPSVKIGGARLVPVEALRSLLQPK
jgi:excisionase family DNA binding protein